METIGHGQTDIRALVLGRLNELGIKPSENLGQHFMVDSSFIDQIAGFVTLGNDVIEVGAGVGHLTEALATRAGRVTAIELDKRYEPILSEVEATHPNVTVVYGDAIALRWEKYMPKRKSDTGVQVVSNLPYHISEPFFRKLAKLQPPVEDAVLVLGKRLIDEIQAPSEDSPDFGAISLLAQTFFHVDYVTAIPKGSFYPTPRTESGLVRLLPKDAKEAGGSRRDFTFRKLYLTEDRNPTVVSVLKDALVEYEQAGQGNTAGKSDFARKSRRMSNVDLRAIAEEYNAQVRRRESDAAKHGNDLLAAQHQALSRVGRMGLPEAILAKPFRLLNNNELKLLSKALGQ